MDPTHQAVIAIHRPANHFVGAGRSFVVSIDGHPVGKVGRRFLPAQSAAEFTVEPGEHTVSVSIDHLQSPALKVVLPPSSRAELAIGARRGTALKTFLPAMLALLVAMLLMKVVDGYWPALLVFGAVFIALFGGYHLLTRKFLGDYWVVWTLEPAGTSSPRLPAGG
jgi:hypothetical protein